MKTIGIIGASPRTVLNCYDELNDIAYSTFGKNSTSDIIISSFNTNHFRKLELEGKQKEIVYLLVDNINNLEKGGAELVMVQVNSMYFNYDKIVKKINIPIIHIPDVFLEELNKKNAKKVILMSTKLVYENNFYKDYFSKSDIEIISPKNKDIKFIDDVIYNELLKGVHNINSKKQIIGIINNLIAKNNDIDAVILGSVLFNNFIRQEHIKIPLLETTLAYTKKVFELANEK